jgi:hypothetical protein
MNKMAVSLLALLSVALVSATAEPQVKYPVLMWGDHTLNISKESSSAIHMTNLLETI